MTKLEAIQAQINQLMRGKQFAKREEATCVSNILWDDEIIERVFEASDGDGLSRGMIILTNHRLITALRIYLSSESGCFIRKKCLIEINDFSYQEIFDVYPEGFGKITIESTRYNRNFTFILKNQDRDFCDYLDTKLLLAGQH